MLVLLINSKRFSFIALILLVSFTLIFLYGVIFKEISDCGCYGKISLLNTSPLLTISRNVFLIILSLVVFLNYPKVKSVINPFKCTLILIVIIIASFLSGLTLNSKGSNFSNYNQNSNYLKNITSTKLSDYIKTSKDSTYLIFIFTYGCSSCWNAIENVKTYESSKKVDKVYGLAAGDASQKKFVMDYLKPNFEIIDLEPKVALELVREFPSAYYVQNDTIKFIMEKDIYSPYTFDMYWSMKNDAHK